MSGPTSGAEAGALPGPGPSDRAAGRAADIERLARLLDDRFRVPLTGWRFGLDGLIGLIPAAGDAITAAVSVYIIYRARRLGVPWRTRLRMALNVALDLAVGAVPVAGDIFDFAWKANQRNVRLIRKHMVGGSDR